MKEKYKIFISYSWHNEDMRTVLLTELKKLDNTEIFSDHLEIKASDYIYPKISKGIDTSNILLVIVTKNSVISPYVRDELLLAHDRGLPIIEISFGNDLENKLPSFLKNTHKIIINDSNISSHVSKITEKLLPLIKDFEEHGSRDELRKEFAKLRRKIIEKHDSPLINLMETNILKKMNSEVEQINTKNYEVDLSRSNDFLRRAGPLFHSAIEIYAVTIEKVSNFWTDENNMNSAYDYLRGQTQNTIRLFVFDKPDEVIKFREILQANYLQYGTNGGAVLITSKDRYYKEILDNFGVSPKLKKSFLEKDFGVLKYKNEELYAWLDEAKLGFKKVELGEQFGVDNQQFKTILNKFNNEIKEGELKQDIYKWSGKELQNLDLLRGLYDNIFHDGEKDTVTHIILFNCESILPMIAEIKSKIEYYSSSTFGEDDRLKCLDVWHGQVDKARTIDKEFYGKLKKNSEYKYMLYMRFENQEALEQWYAHKDHSKIRRDLYSKLSQKAEELYLKIDKISSINEEEIEKIFHEIENIISPKHIKRMDYIYEHRQNTMKYIQAYSFLKGFLNRKKHGKHYSLL